MRRVGCCGRRGLGRSPRVTLSAHLIGEEVGSCGRSFPLVGLGGVGGRVVVYRKFSGGQRPAETTEAMSEELSPVFFEVESRSARSELGLEHELSVEKC